MENVDSGTVEKVASGLGFSGIGLALAVAAGAAVL